MAMMNELEVTDKPHKNDDFRDFAAHLQPGYWIFRPRMKNDVESRLVGSRKPRTTTGTEKP